MQNVEVPVVSSVILSKMQEDASVGCRGASGDYTREYTGEVG